jgi:hypothetical protein
LRANLAQFCLLVLVNALVGGMVGQEQTVLPLLAEQHFHLTGYTFLLTYVLAFGITKAAANYVAGTWSDRVGRKPVLEHRRRAHHPRQPSARCEDRGAAQTRGRPPQSHSRQTQARRRAGEGASRPQLTVIARSEATFRTRPKTIWRMPAATGCASI